MLYRVLTFLFLLVSSILFGQQADDDVKVTIEKFFEGFHKGDTVLMKQTLHSSVLLQTAFKDKYGNDQLRKEDVSTLLNAIANRPSDQKWDERLLSFNIQIDGNMANAWTPYEFWFNGEFSHCGVNSFQLFYDGASWKIIYLIDTRRRSGCKDSNEN